MADLGWTTVEWQALFQKIGTLASLWHFLKRCKYVLGSSETHLFQSAGSAELKDLRLKGIILGLNTTYIGSL